MAPLIFILLVLLLIKFPPGTTVEWSIGGTRVIWPIGWCLALALVLSLFMLFFRKH